MSYKTLIAGLVVLPILSTAALADDNIWDGVYFGALAGFTKNQLNTEPTAGGTKFKTDLSGGTIGLTAGFNASTNNFVYGLEGDFSASNVEGTVRCSATQDCKTTESWNATLRARAGFLHNNILFYGTGGAAWSNAKSVTSPATGGSTGSYRKTVAGWTAGLGAEIATSEKMRVKFEYLHTEYNDVTVPAGTTSSVELSGKSKADQFRIGLNRAF